MFKPKEAINRIKSESYQKIIRNYIIFLQQMIQKKKIQNRIKKFCNFQLPI